MHGLFCGLSRQRCCRGTDRGRAQVCRFVLLFCASWLKPAAGTPNAGALRSPALLGSHSIKRRQLADDKLLYCTEQASLRPIVYSNHYLHKRARPPPASPPGPPPPSAPPCARIGRRKMPAAAVCRRLSHVRAGSAVATFTALW